MNEPEGGGSRLILPFNAIDKSALAVAGGKAANLGELARAGFPVPDGFCVTTAAYDLVAADAALEPTLAALAGTQPEDTTRLAKLATEARSHLSDASVPDVLGRAIAEAYGELGDGEPVAVRSSATAEDLPQASFAGQQDTYLNGVAGPRCGRIARSPTGPRTGSTRTVCASPSSCSGWSTPRSLASCSPRTRSRASAARPS
jgi:hypothetical protein